MSSSTSSIVGANVTDLVTGTGASFDQGNQFELGTLRNGPDGDEWIYCHASEILTANNAVLIHETFEVENIDTTSTASAFGHMCGVVETTCADNDFLWVKISGESVLNVATGAAVNTALNSTATAGRLDDDATAGAEVISGIITTAAESGNVAACLLTRPTVGATLT